MPGIAPYHGRFWISLDGTTLYFDDGHGNPSALFSETSIVGGSNPDFLSLENGETLTDELSEPILV